MLHIKYRPQDWNEIVGNAQTVESLQGMFDSGKALPHAFMLHGKSGTGKTTTARIIAAKLGAQERDITEINAANSRGIDTAREIIDQMRYSAIGGSGVRVYIIDECQSLTKDFQQAILKALEDAPAHVYFILCTTDPEKLLLTVRNRCSMFAFSGVPEKKLTLLLRRVSAAEEADVDPGALKAIAEKSDGCPRQALMMLGQIISLATDKQLAAVQSFVTSEAKVIDLCRALMAKEKWSKVAGMVKVLEEEPESIRRAVLGYFTTVLLGGNVRAAWIIECFREPYYNTGKAGLVLSCYQATMDA